jgi:zinc protease
MTRASLGIALAVALSGAVAVVPAHADDFRASAPSTMGWHRPRAPSVREAKLANGVRVLVAERRGGLPIVAVRLVSDVGALQAGASVSHLAAESALAGESDLARAFNEIGASRSVHADWDGVKVSAECLTPALDRAIELAWNTANEASFRDAFVKDARDRALREQEDTHWSATRALDEALYPAGDPMHDGLVGARANAEKLTPAQLEAYFARAFAADHVTLIVVGDTTLEAVTESARKWLGGAGAASTAPARGAVPAIASTPPKRALVVVDHPGSTQSSIALGAIGVSRTSADLPAVEVLVATLRHRLDQILRQRYAFPYGFRPSATSERSRGQIRIEGKMETARTGQALRDVLAAIDRLRTVAIDDTELASSKELRRSLDPRREETNAAAADALSELVEQGMPLDTWPRELIAVDRVTKEDVLRVAQTYLDPAHVPIVVVGNAKAIVPSLPDVGDAAKTP